MKKLTLMLACLLTLATQVRADDYPYCTNGSDTGNGYGWDTSVTDPNGSHSCLVPSHSSSKPASDGIPGGGNSCDTGDFYCSTSTSIRCYAWADAFHVAHCELSGFPVTAYCWVTDAEGNLQWNYTDPCPAN